MVDVQGDVLRPPHGTTPAAVKSNKMSVMPLYHSFQELFQTEAPLVHVLCEELCGLVCTMMGRYVKASVYQNKTGKDLKEVLKIMICRNRCQTKS